MLLGGESLGNPDVPGPKPPLVPVATRFYDGLAVGPASGQSLPFPWDDAPLLSHESLARPAPGGLELGLSGETTDFDGQLAATLSARLVWGRFSSTATVLVQPQPGLRIEGRYALPARTRRQHGLPLVATTTIFPAEKTRAAIGFDMGFGTAYLFADIFHEHKRSPEAPQ